jgi:transposase-like protein
LHQADIEDGHRAGVTMSEDDGLAALRRELRTLRTDDEILKRLGAYFAGEDVLPK